MKAIFLCETTSKIYKVYDAASRAALLSLVGLEDTVYTRAELLADPARFREVEMIFSTWGMPTLTEEEIATTLPHLRALFYAAGSVQAFARPFLARGIRVFSAAAANAVPVAELTVAEIILANKGFYRTSRIALVPLRYGAGIKGKVIEALRYGTPVVTTSVGSEGIADAESVMLVEDDAKTLAEKLARLYHDGEALAKMSRDGVAYIQNNFSPKNAIEIIGKDFGLS